MKFERIELKNWKNFTAAEVELEQRAFIIGPNASGKSNFLDALRFLRDLVLPGGGLAEAVRIRGGMKSVRSLYARRESEVAIKVRVRLADRRSWVYDLAFNAGPGRDAQPVVLHERVRVHSSPDNGGGKLLLDRPDKEDRKDPERLTQTAIEQTIANKNFRELADFLRSIRYLHLVPQVVREGASKPDAVVGEDSMGRDLLDRIRETPPRSRKARLKRIEEVLNIAAPAFESLELFEDRKGRPHLQVRFSHWRPQGAYQNETQFSDGTLRLIALVWSLQEKSGPLLLEEPELSLHAALLAKLPPFIHRGQKAAGNRQVILSTHSEHLLRDKGIGVDELLLVEPGSEGSSIRNAATVEAIRSLMVDGGLTASEAALSRTEVSQLSLFDKVTP